VFPAATFDLFVQEKHSLRIGVGGLRRTTTNLKSEDWTHDLPRRARCRIATVSTLGGCQKEEVTVLPRGSINYIGAGGGALDSVRNIFDLRNLASQPIGKPVLLKRTQCHQRKLQGNDKAGSWCEVASSSRTPRVSNAQAPSRCLSELGRSAPLE